MQGGEYRKMPYKLGPKKFCEFITNDMLVVPEIFATTSLPKAETCPFPAVNIFVLFIYLGSFWKAPTISGRLHCLWILSRFVNYFKRFWNFYNLFMFVKILFVDISKAPAFLNGRFKIIGFFEKDGNRHNYLEGYATLQHYM